MNMTEKMDVLDLIITVLQEHEKALDALVGRLEKLLGDPGDEARQRELVRQFWREL